MIDPREYGPHKHERVTMTMLLAKNVKLAELTSWGECSDAIDAIEAEPRNIKGSYRAWASGYETELTAAAQRKVDAIRRKMDKFDKEDEDC